MDFSGIDYFCIFQEIEKVRLLIFKGIKEIEVNTKNLSFIIKNMVLFYCGQMKLIKKIAYQFMNFKYK